MLRRVLRLFQTPAKKGKKTSHSQTVARPVRGHFFDNNSPQLELTNVCNIKCNYCYTPPPKKNETGSQGDYVCSRSESDIGEFF